VILAGDIGGTNTRLAFFDVKDDRPRLVVKETFSSREHASLDEIVRQFAAAHKLPVECACFGLAGPVRHGRVETTNLAWVVDARRLAEELRIKSVTLLNDLEANAYGISALEPNDFAVINGGSRDAAGNGAVIAAGTGLGEAGLYWDGTRHRPFACEGGHADFAPHDELEVELFRYLKSRFGHVSWERVLSGPGLKNIYEFLRDTGHGDESEDLRGKIDAGNPAAVISQAAMAGSCDLCVKALDLFVSLYGAEAGNLALKLMATGGVYIGGGIAPKILKALLDGNFLKAFVDKGRFKPFMDAIPVRVILDERTALLGAALCAARSAQEMEAR